MNKPLYYLPEDTKEIDDPEFWKVLTSEGFKKAVNFLILNTLRSGDAERMDDNQCRVMLARAQAFTHLLDFPKALLSQQETDTATDELPE